MIAAACYNWPNVMLLGVGGVEVPEKNYYTCCHRKKMNCYLCHSNPVKRPMATSKMIYVLYTGKKNTCDICLMCLGGC